MATKEDYKWRTFPAYRLPESKLDEFLKELFGAKKFYIRVSKLAHFLGIIG